MPEVGCCGRLCAGDHQVAHRQPTIFGAALCADATADSSRDGQPPVPVEEELALPTCAGQRGEGISHLGARAEIDIELETAKRTGHDRRKRHRDQGPQASACNASGDLDAAVRDEAALADGPGTPDAVGLTKSTAGKGRGATLAG